MKNEVMKNQELISDYKVDADYMEPTFADFVSRRTFINRTGVFVFPIKVKFYLGGIRFKLQSKYCFYQRRWTK